MKKHDDSLTRTFLHNMDKEIKQLRKEVNELEKRVYIIE